MATQRAGEITLREGLVLLRQLDPCGAVFGRYESYDQDQSAYDVWKDAPSDDIEWVLACIDPDGALSCLQAYSRSYQKYVDDKRRMREDAQIAYERAVSGSLDTSDSQERWRIVGAAHIEREKALTRASSYCHSRLQRALEVRNRCVRLCRTFTHVVNALQERATQQPDLPVSGGRPRSAVDDIPF